MKFTKKKLALAIGGALITMSVLVSGCSTRQRQESRHY